jgi:outer membrane protein assembly factor BamD (BamD/ComL family)
MYNTWSRYALMATFALSALVSLYFNQYQLAAIAGFLFAFILWSHFKHSSVLLASKHFKDADYERTEKILAEVKNPDRLAKNRRGYYEFMKANIALQREDFETAEFHFQIASRFPLGGQNDKAFVMIHLANLALRKKDGERAKAYIEKVKELATTSRAKEIIKIIEKEANGLA